MFLLTCSTILHIYNPMALLHNLHCTIAFRTALLLYALLHELFVFLL